MTPAVETYLSAVDQTERMRDSGMSESEEAAQHALLDVLWSGLSDREREELGREIRRWLEGPTEPRSHRELVVKRGEG